MYSIFKSFFTTRASQYVIVAWFLYIYFAKPGPIQSFLLGCFVYFFYVLKFWVKRHEGIKAAALNELNRINPTASEEQKSKFVDQYVDKSNKQSLLVFGIAVLIVLCIVVLNVTAWFFLVGNKGVFRF